MLKLTDVAFAAWLAIAGVGLWGCAWRSERARPAVAGAAYDPNQVVAEVGGRKVTLKELDANGEEFDAAERARG